MVSRSSCSMVTRSRKSQEVATVKAAGVGPVLQVWFGVQQPDERENSGLHQSWKWFLGKLDPLVVKSVVPPQE